MSNANQTPSEDGRPSPKGETLKKSTVLIGANAYPQRGVYESVTRQANASQSPQQEKAAG